MDMHVEAVQYQDLSLYNVIVGCFSRFHWLYPLQTKHSRGVKEYMKKIYDVHDTPGTLQSDSGEEVKGNVKRFCQKKKIKMIQSRPYNPSVQGKA